jgi:hypothetical protein
MKRGRLRMFPTRAEFTLGSLTERRILLQFSSYHSDTLTARRIETLDQVVSHGGSQLASIKAVEARSGDT